MNDVEQLDERTILPGARVLAALAIRPEDLDLEWHESVEDLGPTLSSVVRVEGRWAFVLEASLSPSDSEMTVHGTHVEGLDTLLECLGVAESSVIGRADRDDG